MQSQNRSNGTTGHDRAESNYERGRKALGQMVGGQEQDWAKQDEDMSKAGQGPNGGRTMTTLAGLVHDDQGQDKGVRAEAGPEPVEPVGPVPVQAGDGGGKTGQGQGSTGQDRVRMGQDRAGAVKYRAGTGQCRAKTLQRLLPRPRPYLTPTWLQPHTLPARPLSYRSAHCSATHPW